MPVRRVYIPKRGSSTKRRPLGIPVIADRVPSGTGRQRVGARVGGAGSSRGPTDSGRAAAAMTRSRRSSRSSRARRPKRPWVLDADLAGAFDRIAHDHILAMLGTFPARGMVRAVAEGGRGRARSAASHRGGNSSGRCGQPRAAERRPDGMEQVAGVRYQSTGSIRVDSPAVIRYADDFVVLCHTRQDALEVKAKLAKWLAPRGLAFNEDKTRVVTLEEGFDFLGFNVRRYRDKPLIKPSKAAVRRIRERLRTELRSLRGSNAQAVIKRLNPIIRGWANYYRTQVSSEVFDALDDYLWRLTWKWATYSHPNKPKPWVVRPVLRQVQQVQAGPVGVRRPPQRRLHAQVRLDPHPPTPDRQAWSVTRRPRACRLLGLATAQGAAADQQDHPGAHQLPGRSLRDLQRPPVRRREPATNPTRVGAVAGHPHRDHHDRDAARQLGDGWNPSHTRRVPTRPRPGTAGPPTSHQGLLEPDAGKLARPVVCPANGYVEDGLVAAAFSLLSSICLGDSFNIIVAVLSRLRGVRVP